MNVESVFIPRYLQWTGLLIGAHPTPSVQVLFVTAGWCDVSEQSEINLGITAMRSTELTRKTGSLRNLCTKCGWNRIWNTTKHLFPAPPSHPDVGPKADAYTALALSLLTWRIWWAPSSASNSNVYSTFETWWHTRRNQIWSFSETDESI